MHEANVDLLRKEAQRLLKEEIKLLEQIKDTPNVLDAAGENVQTFDSNSLPIAIERLQGEEYKLGNLELVLAVVGTMKAGKSTTINAIVGMEVLPNRNRPMTALPTLITHTPGVTTPKLIFENTAPVNELIKQLGEAMVTAPKELLESLSDNADMKELLEQIQAQQLFVKKYEGTEEIFNFLKGLNDLVRLSSELNVEFPFSAYTRIRNLPVIEVEFTHLSEMKHVQGRLTLLDTPGPNEAGQSHLRPMLRDQLKKASAVLAVLDYTQLKSDADNEIRENLEEVAKVTGDRLYVLVNKFDQQDRNSDDAEAVRKYVSGTLMKDQITSERVYPVSSRLGYLASHAKSEIANSGKLPDYNQHTWVEDFAKEGIGGRRWEERLNDLEEVNDAANYLWDESQFSKPLEDVIFQSYNQAAILTITSAATKLVELAENAKNFLGIRKLAFKKSVDEIQKQVELLQKDINEIKQAEDDVANDTKKALDDVRKGIQNAGEKVQKETLAILNKYFKEGKAIEEKERKEEQKIAEKQKRNEGPADLLSSIFGAMAGKEKQQGRDFSPDDKVIKLESRLDAKELLSKIGDSVDLAIKGSEQTLQKSIKHQVDLFNKSFLSCVDRAKESIEKIKDGMHDFDLIIRSPDIREIQINLPVSDLLEDAAQETAESRTRERRQSGVWGGICSFFNTKNWGWETYSEDIVIYLVDIERTKKDVAKALATAFANMDKLVDTTVQADLKEQTDSFFLVLREKIEHIRGDLIASMSDQQKDQATKERLVNNLGKLERPVPNLLKDSEALVNDIKELIRKQEISNE